MKKKKRRFEVTVRLMVIRTDRRRFQEAVGWRLAAGRASDFTLTKRWQLTRGNKSGDGSTLVCERSEVAHTLSRLAES